MANERVNGNQSKPMVSVIVSTYQHAPYIKECLDSILSQKAAFPFEIVLGEDESTDGTREICIEYANKYPDTIRLFLRSRKDVVYINGYATGRFNFMENLKAARGEYIAICPGDDYWTDSNKLEIQLAAMKSHPECDMSFHPAIERYTKGNKRDKIIKRRSKGSKIFTAGEVILGGGFCPTAAIVMKREVLEPLPEWFHTKAPIGDIYIEILGALSGGLLYIDRVMAVRRANVPGSWGSNRKGESSHEYLRRVELHEECYQMIDRSTGGRYSKEISKKLASYNLISAKKFLKDRKYGEFRRVIEKSWKLSPYYSFKQAAFYFFRKLELPSMGL